ncbi:tRNA pseudouridine(38-40) synthase TruA [Sinanaerobacter chloroacetimidivorans]|jgi:tRNA pseudouridine38-40 synthase|uniref:tRNA pseudouridine synthase A n=1 Tax=Sinanaerobacter chloroacetimidivorans TaxID=2818044 RepID=A0A8J8B3K0_9FIRM|nr:tRNA pseudouridine(38-40) synthase TruA [Sinanaerobacter chloroacetimidivorans]MBR0600414.1 tRNA pseudouridine(38-40) synthase TruA [Sinanaerobacter chloroacetimidivorans]
MKNVLLTIEYDGTNFCGWQRQPGLRTVQGELERVFSILCAQSVQLNGTSRTDAGVHAYGQRASFRGDFGIPVDRMQMAANHLLAAPPKGKKSSFQGLQGDIRIKNVTEVPMDFHARFDAVGKKYIYKIQNRTIPDIFHRNYCYQIPKVLDLESMKEAASYMTGTHDFKCFQAAGGKEMESTVRTIYQIRLYQRMLPEDSGEFSPSEISIEVVGDGFLYNMVRIITGTLVDVGTGKLSPENISGILAGKNRQLAGHTAPPQGLYLAEVYYNEAKRSQR